MPELHVAVNRHVVTYEPDGWPAGVITGLAQDDGGFLVEHVLSLRPHVLLPMIRTALEGPWSYRYVQLQIPASHPKAQGLRALATFAGFKEYDPGNWVIYPA